MPQGRSFHRTVDRNDPGAPAALPPHFPRAATHQGRRCVSSAPVAPCRGGPHSTWPGQATCAAVLAQGASPPRRTPTPRSFGRPAPFVCRSPGQRPTHSLKGSVSEAPAHASAVPVAVEVSTACVYRWQEQCDVTRLRKPNVRGLSGFAPNRCRGHPIGVGDKGPKVTEPRT